MPVAQGGAAKVTGLAAGNGQALFNAWGGLSRTRTEYSGNAGIGNADKFDNRVTNGILGLDYGFTPGMVGGLSLAIDQGGGSMGGNSSTLATRGMSFAPYIGYQINKNLAIDTTLGLGYGEVKTSSTTQVDTKRYFAAANLSYVEWFGNLQMTGRTGYLYAKENYGDLKTSGTSSGGTSSSNALGQFRLGGEIGYWMDGVMPFAGLAYTSDHRSMSSAAGLTDTSKLGNSALLFSLGANFFSLSSGVTGGLFYNQEMGRNNGRNNAIGANIGSKF